MAADVGGDDSSEAHLGGEGRPRTEAAEGATQPLPGNHWPPLSSAESLPKTRRELTAHHGGLGALTSKLSLPALPLQL